MKISKHDVPDKQLMDDQHQKKHIHSGCKPNDKLVQRAKT